MTKIEAFKKFRESFNQAFMDWWCSQSEILVLNQSLEYKLVQFNARPKPYIEDFYVEDENGLFVEALINFVLKEEMPKVHGKMSAYVKRTENSESRIPVRWEIDKNDWTFSVEEENIEVKINKVHFSA